MAKGKKIRDSGVNPYVIRTASRILSAEHQKLQQLRKGHVYQPKNEKQKMPNHYLPATLKPMPSTLVDNPVREKIWHSNDYEFFPHSSK